MHSHSSSSFSRSRARLCLHVGKVMCNSECVSFHNTHPSQLPLKLYLSSGLLRPFSCVCQHEVPAALQERVVTVSSTTGGLPTDAVANIVETLLSNPAIFFYVVCSSACDEFCLFLLILRACQGGGSCPCRLRACMCACTHVFIHLEASNSIPAFVSNNCSASSTTTLNTSELPCS